MDGFLVPRGEALAERLIQLLESPELAQRMSRAATEKAKQHGKDEFVAGWAAVLEKTVELKPRRTRLVGADLDVQSLIVGGRRSRGLLGLRPAAPPDGSRRPRPFVSRRPCVSRPRAGSATSPPLGGAGCGVAGVRGGRGLPVDWTLEGSTFSVRSDVCLRDQLPPGDRPAGTSAEAPARLEELGLAGLLHRPSIASEPGFARTGDG